jgi:hypothetical protein
VLLSCEWVSREDLEAEMLGGQKLQGVLTSLEVQGVIAARGWEAEFPLFTTIHQIAIGEAPPSDITRYKHRWADAVEGLAHTPLAVRTHTLGLEAFGAHSRRLASSYEDKVEGETLLERVVDGDVVGTTAALGEHEGEHEGEHKGEHEGEDSSERENARRLQSAAEQLFDAPFACASHDEWDTFDYGNRAMLSLFELELGSFVGMKSKNSADTSDSTIQAERRGLLDEAARSGVRCPLPSCAVSIMQLTGRRGCRARGVGVWCGLFHHHHWW